MDMTPEKVIEEIIQVTTAGQLAEPEPVLDAAQVLELRDAVRLIPISDHVLDYIVRLVEATHPKDERAPEMSRKYLAWGAGPRAGQYLSLGAKSRALLRGNLQATANDVRAVAHAVFRHRLVTNYTALAEGVEADDLVAQLLERVPEAP